MMRRRYSRHKRTYLLYFDSSEASSYPNPITSVDTNPLGETLTLSQVKKQGIEEIEQRYFRMVLSQTQGKVKPGAEAAGISTRQLHKLMSRYGASTRRNSSNPIEKGCALSIQLPAKNLI